MGRFYIQLNSIVKLVCINVRRRDDLCKFYGQVEKSILSVTICFSALHLAKNYTCRIFLGRTRFFNYSMIGNNFHDLQSYFDGFLSPAYSQCLQPNLFIFLFAAILKGFKARTFSINFMWSIQKYTRSTCQSNFGCSSIWTSCLL